MSYRKKFSIKGLKPGSSFSASLEPVLGYHLKRIYKRADKYLETQTAEHLHNLRIALRRFRYAIELYAAHIKPRRFEEVYELAVNLQNVLGDRRDVDVMQERLISLYRVGEAELPALIVVDLEQSKALLNTQIEKTLTEFLRNKQLRKLAG